MNENKNNRLKHRARRIRLHPERSHIPHRQSLLQEALHSALGGLMQAQARHQKSQEDIAALRVQLRDAREVSEGLRRRYKRESDQHQQSGAKGFIEALLPVLDGFDQAIASAESSHDADGILEGMRAIVQLFEKALDSQGVQKIDAAGKEFDPNFHEALAVEKTEDVPANTVVDVLQNGYRLNERLVRPARVRIAQKP